MRQAGRPLPAALLLCLDVENVADEMFLMVGIDVNESGSDKPLVPFRAACFGHTADLRNGGNRKERRKNEFHFNVIALLEPLAGREADPGRADIDRRHFRQRTPARHGLGQRSDQQGHRPIDLHEPGDERRLRVIGRDVIQQTVRHGRRAGVKAALGAVLGNSTHAVAAGAGMALFLRRLPVVLDALQLTGAVYLIWLGLSTLARARRQEGAPQDATAPAGTSSAFREGLLVTLLNPSIVVFYLTVVANFLDPAAP